MISEILPVLLIDGYKADHRRQYPKNTQIVYSNFTPRQSRIEGIDSVVVFGIQYFIKEYLIDRWNKYFFQKEKEEIMRMYKRRMDDYLGKDAIPCEHIAALHDLGFLPIKIKALPEGSLCPIGVPLLTIVNTLPEFFWLTNYFETIISNVLWKPMTSATIAFQYRKVFEAFCEKTGYDKSFIQWQAHDFSFRGMSASEDALLSAAAHLLSFTGSDTVPAIDFLEMFYNADSDKELIAGSVPATEHSVMCMGEQENEILTFKRLITELYPDGIVSIVSDTWDFWKVIGEYLPALKEQILIRNGRVVIRPDSGNPVDIICGFTDSIVHEDENGQLWLYEHNGYKDVPVKKISELEYKGAYQCLWETFGGTINEKGFKCLDTHIGLIYGDSITLARQKQILSKLMAKGFSASNLVLGVGSYTYQYVTRDTFGFAMKATYGIVDGVPKNIFKDPITDRGFKKSAKGLLQVYEENRKIKLKDCCTPEEENQGLLQTVFIHGELLKDWSLIEIRERLNSYL
jgi:nicotinamide phosphoribosyltransferase